MSWKPSSWNAAKDKSAMKVTNSPDTLKTERISSTEKPHSHEIVKVDKPSGSVREISLGQNRPSQKK
jgi:hypothetical protein